MASRYLSIKDVAEITSTSRAFIEDLISKGHLRARKIGRIWRIAATEVDRVFGCE